MDNFHSGFNKTGFSPFKERESILNNDIYILIRKFRNDLYSQFTRTICVIYHSGIKFYTVYTVDNLHSGFNKTGFSPFKERESILNNDIYILIRKFRNDLYSQFTRPICVIYRSGIKFYTVYTVDNFHSGFNKTGFSPLKERESILNNDIYILIRKFRNDLYSQFTRPICVIYHSGIKFYTVYTVDNLHSGFNKTGFSPLKERESILNNDIYILIRKFRNDLYSQFTRTICVIYHSGIKFYTVYTVDNLHSGFNKTGFSPLKERESILNYNIYILITYEHKNAFKKLKRTRKHFKYLYWHWLNMNLKMPLKSLKRKRKPFR